MQIAHSKTGLAIYLTKEEHDALTVTRPEHSNRVWVEINPNSVEKFITLFGFEYSPNTNSTTYAKVANNVKHPMRIMLPASSPKWKALKNVPNFGVEIGIHTESSTSQGPVMYIQRPTMRYTPRTVVRAAKTEETPQAIPLAETPSSLPKVPPKPAEGLLAEASTLGELRHAVALINRAKDAYGDALVLALSNDNKITLLLEIK